MARKKKFTKVKALPKKSATAARAKVKPSSLKGRAFAAAMWEARQRAQAARARRSGGTAKKALKAAPSTTSKKLAKTKKHTTTTSVPAPAAAPAKVEHTVKAKHKSPGAARMRRCKAYSIKDRGGDGMVRPVHFFAREEQRLSDILDRRVPDLQNAIGQRYSPDPGKNAVYAEAVQSALAKRVG